MTRHTRNPEKYTDAREALVISLWPSSVSEKLILAKINALPGEPLTKDQLGRYANRLDVRRTHKGRDWDTNTELREALLRVEWPGPKTRREIYALWLALPGTQGPIKAMENFATYIGLRRGPRRPEPVKPDPPKPVIPEPPPVSTDPFGDAIRAAGIVYRDHPDFGPRAVNQRYRIMSGKPPNHAEMIAAKVAQCSQARSGVAVVNVRGMV